MKYYQSLLMAEYPGEHTVRNLRLLLKFLLVLLAMIGLYSVAFHYLMAAEGQRHSWVTGIYWTLTVMTTLGFGDITFSSDLGRAFSIVVLLSGVIFLLIILPFTFIKFFYGPWIEAESRRRAPRELPKGTRDHVILTNHDSVTLALIEKLNAHHREYVLLIPDLKEALDLHDLGLRVAVGDIDDPVTYQKMRVDRAALVAATGSDESNTTVAFTVRELSAEIPIITTAESPDSEDILQMAGSSKVIRIPDIMGRSFASWTIGVGSKANILSRFDQLIIAEFPAMNTPLVGKTLVESQLRERHGITVVGLWERGRFILPAPDSVITQNSVLFFAASEEALNAFDDVYALYHIYKLAGEPMLIIGAGRIGRAVAQRFQEKEISYTILEKDPARDLMVPNLVEGNAADIHALKKARIDRAPAALITTHDDATNIYLTKYIRSLRPDIQILTRANLDRNVSSLHRAGADFAMSYTSIGANAIFNFLQREDTLMLAEGLNIFRARVPRALVGKNLAQSNIRTLTNCSVVAIKANGSMQINPDPRAPMSKDDELLLIGPHEGERSFLKAFRA